MTEEEIKALTRILDRVDYYRLLKTERTASYSGAPAGPRASRAS